MEKSIQLYVSSAIPIESDPTEERMGASGKDSWEAGPGKKAREVFMEGVTNLSEDHNDLGSEASMFDYSVENHLRATDEIAELCGEPEGDAAFGKTDIERLSSKITFLREWRHFNYKARLIRFAYETQKGNVASEINLPQFSAATVPKEVLSGNTSSGYSKDFVLHVGGPIWGLDWCPRVHHGPHHQIVSEFIAVAVHPPESSYHKIGVPLTGRGMIQIWSLLSVAEKEAEVPLPAKRKERPESISNASNKETQPKRPRGRPKKIIEDTQQKKPRGRPRKKPINKNGMDSEQQLVQVLAIEYPKDSSELHDEVSLNSLERSAQKHDSENQKGLDQQVSVGNLLLATSNNRIVKTNTKAVSCGDGTSIPLLTLNREQEAFSMNSGSNQNGRQDLPASAQKIPDNLSLGLDRTENPIPKHLALPRLVLCLAHNGKVAWDIKWRPCNVHCSECKPRMGYLAVLLGNGSMEVWEVPSPHIMKHLYFPHSEGADPRFVKLDPVFRCSKLKCADRQSIPLTLEWSASVPHDLILAGCHDGTVALWKFAASDSCKDTRPLLCFSADAAPIRTLAWAPVENDPVSANVIITGGHEGFKFWDLRDPFRPLWHQNTAQRTIYSLDWLPDPRCVVLSYDDGTLRILSMSKAALDVPVTGKPLLGTPPHQLPSYLCSAFSIWSVHASTTGRIAYCCADGTALNFQLTAKAVEKDPFRNRAPHFLCGSITEDKSTLTVNTPLPDTPFPMKKSTNEWSNAPRTLRGYRSQSNQIQRAKELQAGGQNPDNQILSLCYGDEVGLEFEPEDTLPSSSRSKNTRKPKNSGKKGMKDDQALVSGEEGPGVMRMEFEQEDTLPSSLKSKQTRKPKNSSKKGMKDDQALVSREKGPEDMRMGFELEDTLPSSLNRKKTRKPKNNSKKGTKDDRALVCREDGPEVTGMEFEPEDTLPSSSKSKQTQKLKNSSKKGTKDDRVLVVCREEGPEAMGMEFEPEDSLPPSSKSKQTRKQKNSSKKGTKDDRALVCREEGPEVTGMEFESEDTLPSSSKSKETQKPENSSKKGTKDDRVLVNRDEEQEKKHEDRALVCREEDPEAMGMEFEPEDTLPSSSKSKETQKPENSSKKGTKDDRALANRNEEQEKKHEVLPPKIVSMHRVRWNMNRGSERWLCYGGAAGILRCQEIALK